MYKIVHCTIENDKLMVKYRADVQYWTYTCHTMENDNMHLEAKSGISENRFYWEDVFIFEEDKKRNVKLKFVFIVYSKSTRFELLCSIGSFIWWNFISISFRKMSFEPDLNQRPKDICHLSCTVLRSTNWAIEGDTALFATGIFNWLTMLKLNILLCNLI